MGCSSERWERALPSCLLCSRPSPHAGWVFDACLTPSPVTMVFGLTWPVWEVGRLWLEVEMCQL